MRTSISLEEAREKVFIYRDETNVEVVRLEDAIGRTLAECTCTLINQPPFPRSAMDGYAVCSAATEPGKTYKVIDEIDAGDTRHLSLKPGEVMRIMTGACCPEGADMVIPQEMSNGAPKRVIFYELPKKSNICPIGEDFTSDDILVNRDTVVDANVIACAAAGGATSVHVYKRARVAIISTGTELRRVGSELEHGQIYDSNQPFLRARVKQYGGEISMATYCEDDLDEIAKTIKDAAAMSDLVITTGGVSVGTKDLIEAAVKKNKGKVIFHGIDVKPGMPTMFSVVDGKPVLSLSGNPFAASAMFDILNPMHEPIVGSAILANDYTSPRKTRRIIRGVLADDMVIVAKNEKNGVTKSGVGSNCLVELPKGEEILRSGERVKIYLV